MNKSLLQAILDQIFTFLLSLIWNVNKRIKVPEMIIAKTNKYLQRATFPRIQHFDINSTMLTIEIDCSTYLKMWPTSETWNDSRNSKMSTE